MSWCIFDARDREVLDAVQWDSRGDHLIAHWRPIDQIEHALRMYDDLQAARETVEIVRLIEQDMGLAPREVRILTVIEFFSLLPSILERVGQRGADLSRDQDALYRQVFDVGSESYKTGVPLRGNPYSVATLQHIAWHNGWVSQQQIKLDRAR